MLISKALLVAYCSPGHEDQFDVEKRFDLRTCLIIETVKSGDVLSRVSDPLDLTATQPLNAFALRWGDGKVEQIATYRATERVEWLNEILYVLWKSS